MLYLFLVPLQQNIVFDIPVLGFVLIEVLKQLGHLEVEAVQFVNRLLPVLLERLSQELLVVLTQTHEIVLLRVVLKLNHFLGLRE